MGGTIRTFSLHFIAVFGFVLSSAFAKAPEHDTSALGPEEMYSEIISQGLTDKALLNAIDGYSEMKSAGDLDKEVLIVIDYTKSSNQDRFFILNMRDTTLTHSLLVAHGRNSGNEFATSFSNVSGSYMSSLGFFKTAETYQGKHGLSLRMDGLEDGINHRARERAIVIHQADYVSLDFADRHGRIGRSLGCPALPIEDYAEVINTIKEGCLLYIYGGDESYALQSSFLNES